MGRIILELTPKAKSDFSKVIEDYSNNRPVDLSQYEVKEVGLPIDVYKQEFISYITENGLTAYLNREALNEKLVPPNHPRNVVENIFSDFLRGIEVTTELIIVDPYFFSNRAGEDYSQSLANILEPFFSTLQKIIFVTRVSNRSMEPRVKDQVFRHLAELKSGIRLIHKPSESFHDRFWINKIEQKGFLTGTSLNGFSRNYALVDYLKHKDVEDVIHALNEERLL